MQNKRILITSVGTATAIGLIKAIKKIGGYFIVGTDINEYGFTAGSLIVDKYYKVPYAIDDSFVLLINKIINDEKVDLVVPINDSEIASLSQSASDPRFIIPDVTVIEKVRNKHICSEILNKNGVLIPPMVDDTFVGERIVRDNYGVGSKGIKILEPNNKLIIDNDNQFAQEFIHGDEYTVDVLCDRDGNPAYIIPRKRIEVKAGVATKVLIENNEKLINVVKKILKVFRLPGFSNIQFIHSYTDNRYYFIEINYRFSGCGAASLLAAPQMISVFLEVALNNAKAKSINCDVAWNSIVTRFYEELIFPCK